MGYFCAIRLTQSRLKRVRIDTKKIAIMSERYRNIKPSRTNAEVFPKAVMANSYFCERKLVLDNHKPFGVMDEHQMEISKTLSNPIYYLQQKLIAKRLKEIDIPNFCPGSVVTVRHRNMYDDSISEFTGLCVKKAFDCKYDCQFRLMNSFKDFTKVSKRFYLYDPTIIEIKVLRHTSMTRDQLTAFFELPAKYHNHHQITPVPYTPEPVPFVFEPKEKEDVLNELSTKIESIVMRRRRRLRRIDAANNDTTYISPKPHFLEL